MTTRKMHCASLICLLLVVWTGQSAAQIARQTGMGNQPSIGPSPQIDPKQWEKQMQAEAAERSRRFAAEREQRRMQMLRDAQRSGKEAERYRDESIKQALRATDEQWKVIFPKFDKVRTIMRQARYGLGTVGYSSGGSSGGSQAGNGPSSTSGANAGADAGIAGGMGGATVGGRGWRSSEKTENRGTGTWSQSGWKWVRPSENKKRSELTLVESAAEDLLDGLENQQRSDAQIQQKLGALRKLRQEVVVQLLKAQQELREVLTFEQEATLVLMGYLE